MPYRKLNVYKRAYALALEVHKLSLDFPKLEQFGIAQQLRASSKSIPVNIAEGMGKQESPKDVTRFVRVAVGSCEETKVWLDFSKDLGYIKPEDHKSYYEAYCEIGRMLNGIIKRYINI